MGISTTNGQQHSRQKRLTALAEQLDPARPPWYVHVPDRRTPSPGWWWMPQGLRVPQYLGYNAITAEMQIRGLLEAQEMP